MCSVRAAWESDSPRRVRARTCKALVRASVPFEFSGDEPVRRINVWSHYAPCFLFKLFIEYNLAKYVIFAPAYFRDLCRYFTYNWKPVLLN
jgi:hypothetical protein